MKNRIVISAIILFLLIMSIAYAYKINPLFDKLIPTLQKQVNYGLKMLGLLPFQTAERQKLVIIKKLRQKYETLCGEFSIEARQKFSNIPKNQI